MFNHTENYYSGGGDGVWKIIIAQIGSLLIAYLIFRFNKQKERNLIKEKLKIEIGGICDIIMRHGGAFEMTRTHHLFNSRVAHFATTDNARDALNKSATDFLMRSNDSGLTLFLTKSELLEKVSHLFLYLENTQEKEKLKKLAWEIHNHKFQDDRSIAIRYINAKNVIEADKIFQEDKKILNYEEEDSPLQKSCKQIQVIVNPLFYKNKT